MQTITLNVQGMSCGHCVKAVEGSIGQLEGVTEVKVTLDAGQVEVSFNDVQLSLEKIKETIEEQGFDVV